MQQETVNAATVPEGHEAVSLSWQQPPGLIGLSFTNFALRIVTLGIYHFWAKTEVRKRIWTAVRINGEPLTYTGRGLELFLGFVIAFGLVILPIFAIITGLTLTFGPKHIVTSVAVAIVYIGLAVLVPVAIFRAMRYRMARTRWRGIRGSLEGSSVGYAWTYVWTLLLIPLTLGWITPWRTTKLQSYLTNNMRFGNRPLRFDAKSGRLYGPFALLWFATAVGYFGFFSGFAAIYWTDLLEASRTGRPYVPSATEAMFFIGGLFGLFFLLGLVGAWYQARIINHFANHTHFESAKFSGRATAGGLIWLTITNWLILLAGAVLLVAIVAGLAAPFVDFRQLATPVGAAMMQALIFAMILGFTLFGPIVQARTAGYVVRHLAIAGTAPLAEIEQTEGANVRYGEGLAEAFDIDAF